jgi:hypothetical protein
MSTTRLTAAAVGLATLAAVGVIGVSAASAATTKFGANLTSNTQPSNASNSSCQHADSALTATPCTRVATNFADVGAVNNKIQAPKDGTIKKIKLIAGEKGTMTPFVVRLKNFDTSNYTAKGRATAKGPRINYVSSVLETTYKVQSFPVNIKVKQGQYLAIRSKRTSMERCNSGGGKQLLFQPPLLIGDPFNPSDGRGECVLLIQAVMQ